MASTINTAKSAPKSDRNIGSEGKWLASALYILTFTCVLEFIWQSIAFFILLKKKQMH